MAKKKILVVDDEPNIVTALEYLLAQSGYEVAVAENGEEALAAVARIRPDLVLLDIMMPRLNGYEVCRRLRERPESAGIKIVILSAKGREVDAAKGLSLGADLYVSKPFSSTELVARIQELLAGA